MIVIFGGLIEDGKDCVHGFGKSFERVCIAEKYIGAGVIEIEGREAKLWIWEIGFWMWATGGFTVADLVVSTPDRSLETLRSAYSSCLSFLRSSSLEG